MSQNQKQKKDKEKAFNSFPDSSVKLMTHQIVFITSTFNSFPDSSLRFLKECDGNESFQFLSGFQRR